MSAARTRRARRFAAATVLTAVTLPLWVAHAAAEEPAVAVEPAAVEEPIATPSPEPSAASAPEVESEPEPRVAPDATTGDVTPPPLESDESPAGQADAPAQTPAPVVAEEPASSPGAKLVWRAPKAVTDAATSTPADGASAAGADARGDGAADASPGPIPAGETASYEFDVVDATEIRVVVHKPAGVEARLRFGDTTGPWSGGESAAQIVELFPSEASTGTATLEVRNTTDRQAWISYATSFRQVGGVAVNATASLDQDRILVTASPTNAEGPLRARHITAFLTDTNGTTTTLNLYRSEEGDYRALSRILRPGSYTVEVRAEIDGVTYLDILRGGVEGTDDQGPVVTLATDPVAPYHTGWFVNHVAVVASAEDEQGVMSVRARINGGPAFPVGEDMRVPITADGVSEVEVWALDFLNNISESVWITVRRDITQPEISVGGAFESRRVSPGAVVLADFACEDPHSGIDECSVRVDGSSGRLEPGDPLPTDVEGSFYWEIFSSNGAGMTRYRNGTYYVTDDVTPPAVELHTQPSTANARGWFNQSVDVQLLASDPSGVAWIETSWDGETWSRTFGAEARAEARDAGEFTLHYRAADYMGNVTADRTRLIRIDRYAPEVTIASPLPRDVEAGSALVADYDCTDDLSGIYSCVGTVPAGASVPTGELGVHEFRVAAIDNAGNLTVEVVEYTVIPGPLGATATWDREPNEHGWFSDSVQVTVAPIPGSGAERVHWELEGAQTGEGSTTSTDIIEVTAEGFTRINVWAEDANGRSEPVGTEVQIDRTAPEVTWDVGSFAPVGMEFDVGEVIGVRAECFDGVSGVAECERSWPNGDRIDTSTPGVFSLTASATDYAGNRTVEVFEYRVIGADPGEDPGEDPGQDPGEDPGQDPGQDPGDGPGGDPAPGGPGDGPVTGDGQSPGSPSGPGGLSATGTELGMVLAASVLLASAGALISMWSRRRATAHV